MITSQIMQYYYIAPLFLTLVFIVSYALVQVMLAIFDRLNPIWDFWDRLKRKIPAIVVIEIAYYLAVLYYIVYWQLSGSA